MNTDLKPAENFDLFKNSYLMQIEELQGNLARINREMVCRAAEMILAGQGKLICTGMGKSGLIARKLAATFSSTGTPAFFLHPGDSLHGDLGAVQRTDLILVIGKSGESEEVITLLKAIKKLELPVISILGTPRSTAGSLSDVIIPATVRREADSLNLAPTASSTVALVVGDALATMVSELREFKSEHFAAFHPNGQLGKRLLLNVEDLLITDQGIPVASETTSMQSLLEIVTRPNLGGAMIVDAAGCLTGIVTDGDLRRAIMKYGNVLECQLQQIMTDSPVYVEKGIRAYEALKMMQNRSSQISVLPVVDADRKPLGLLRIHDLVRAGL